MSQTNSKSFKIFKSVLIILCVIIVNAVVWVGLGILLTQKSGQSMPKEEDIESILSLIRNLF
jgi:hypothetical protein